MPANTPRGYTYATSDDANDLALISQRLAEQVDADVQGVANRVMTLEADTGWNEPTLTNSWVPYDAGVVFPVPRWRRKNWIITLQGSMKSGTPAAAFTLPVGARPLKRLDFIAPASNGVVQVRVEPTGTVSPLFYFAGGSNGIVSLNGITFPAEQ
jgi:hypothetical protein